MTRQRCLALVCEGLHAPPTSGFHIHLLSLARAASRHLPTRAFAWADPGSEEWQRWSASHDDAEPSNYVGVMPLKQRTGSAFARKRHYVSHALDWVRENAAEDSVVWVRDYSTALTVLPQLMPRRAAWRDIRFVYDASSFMELEVGWRSGVRLHGLKAKVEPWFYRAFDAVRTLSDTMRDHLIAKGVPAEKILVIPVGSQRRTRLWQSRGQLRKLLYTGSAQAWQGLGELLEAMSLLQQTHPGITLTVVGAREAAGMTVPANVEFRGWVPQHTMADIYLEHDAFVIPRPKVPLTDVVVPMKVVEAMSFGVPMMATDLASIRYVTGDAAHFVVDNQPATLAAGIAELIEQPQRLQAMHEVACQRAPGFAWDSIGRDLAQTLFPESPAAARA